MSLLPDTQEHTKRWLSCLTDGMSGAALAFLWTYPSPSFIYLVNIYSACPAEMLWVHGATSGPVLLPARTGDINQHFKQL